MRWRRLVAFVIDWCCMLAWIAVVAAEYIGASAGLGLMITNAATSLATPVVIAGMIVIGLIGAGVSALIGWLAHRRFDDR